ncbi:MAG TPA: 4-(cytidine 5'-diphospho)-2-C-methyl-D-erythritol kinase [Pyrinomonadaceae bacterium]|nr:4-(cytidine 5'-diphospho)-2-C-methyl-D-erythritol kinase [Pyrinomonadaceae bacterium]HMP65185.1 4-(cytidine 5'-diphospho)-2-C-methyl-D-erythritol kinase [Pyrinomonadaceae bacterium]
MQESHITLPSFAKINLRLKVLGKRPDGYHEIVTVFQTVSLADRLRFETADDVSARCDSPSVPSDENNLAVRAAVMLREAAGIKKGVTIHIEKHIPAPGGLGGGSSNAAVTLLALNRLWRTGMTAPELAAIGAELGSDVPFFLVGGTAVGHGRGESVSEIPDIEEKLLLIVTPPVSVPASEAYGRLDAADLTSTDPNRNLLVCRKWAENADLRQLSLENDLEGPVFAAYPDVRTAKERLLELGAVNALMSGSGASVFGIFDNETTRQTAMKALGVNADWRGFAVATISRSEYREALDQVF